MRDGKTDRVEMVVKEFCNGVVFFPQSCKWEIIN
jgi:hypothetical protein